jgi:integrase
MASRRGHGEGSIHKRNDGRWCGVVDLGWENGKRKRKYVYGETRRAVAEKMVAAQRAKDQGLPLPDERRTTGQYLEWWIAEVVPGTVKARTAEGYAGIVNRYLVPQLGTVRLTRLGPEHVQEMMRALEERGLSPRTRQYARAVLRRALGHAERWGIVVRNAAALVDSPKLPPPRTDDALDIADAKALLTAAHGDRLEALVTLALSVGLRKGEALGLKWDAVDLDAGFLRVAASLDRVRGKGLVLSEPKTARSRRAIPLPEACAEALRGHRFRQIGERLRAGDSWQDDGFVFTTPLGAPLDPRNVTRWFHALAQRAGLGKWRFHALRHSAATLMLAQGVPLEVISRTLGHAGYAITADVYAHVGVELLRGGAEAMDRALSSA